MLAKIRNLFAHIDWPLFVGALFLSIAGLITMNSLSGDNSFFHRQIVWLLISIVVFFGASIIDWRFLRRTGTIMGIFSVAVVLLLLLFALGSIFKGAQSWFDFGAFAFQPTDFAKLALVLLLSKYFNRRHVEIAHIRHIIISGLYALLIFLLVFVQPDFGGAIIIFCIWLGLVLVSGISPKHLLLVVILGTCSLFLLWNFTFKDYQKQRIISFIHPLADIRGAGYNAYQSTVAVGSGELLGKGIGYGTQSKLRFLPEYETDFIFASFAEEWGFVGVIILFILYGLVIWRILALSYKGETNFEILFGLGIAITFVSHFLVHVGMNIGLLPVTGITLPFMSYGGSHLLAELLSLGVLVGMKKYSRVTHKEKSEAELIQIAQAEYRA